MEHFKLVFKRGELIVEISSHEKEWVEKKEKEYKNLIDSIVTKNDKIQIVDEIKRNKDEITKDIKKFDGMPINEFYRNYLHDKIKSRPDIATFFVYYLNKTKNQSEITSGDIRNLFKDIQYPGWNKINIVDALNKAKRKALLNSVGSNWSLTITGEDYVLNSLSEVKK